MGVNNDILQGRWGELKGHVKRRWGKLSDLDIANMSGKQEELVVALRRRYGYGQGQAVMEINRWISDHDANHDREAGTMLASSNVQRHRPYRSALGVLWRDNNDNVN